jgi:hypothetical protein
MGDTYKDIRMRNQSGKGDIQRPYDRDQYNKNYDNIFRKNRIADIKEQELMADWDDYNNEVFPEKED